MKDEFVYVAFPEFITELKEELTQISTIKKNLLFSPVYQENVCFAEDIWLNPQIIHIESIAQAVKLLKRINKYWFLYPFENYRRSKLIEQELKNPFSQPLTFPLTNAIPQTGVFCLLDANTLLYSTKRWKHIPIGNVLFIEDKLNPPNRAYLKLWEAFTFLNKTPQADDIVLDLGAAPGGWTFVLEKLGAQVIAVDKAPLVSSLMNHKNIKFLQRSAFSLNPNEFTKIDWLCADIACYPDRLYKFVTHWLASGKIKNMICTIKLQGKTDFAWIKQFQEIPNAMVIHLYYNKHEATFFYSNN